MKKFLLGIAVSALIGSAPAFADSGEGTQSVPTDQSSGQVAQGSAAQFDKRLPPVLPGESIKTGKGSMKVWSSSGPVPVNEAPPAAPEPWRQQYQQDQYGNSYEPPVSVIIDGRPIERVRPPKTRPEGR